MASDFENFSLSAPYTHHYTLSKQNNNNHDIQTPCFWQSLNALNGKDLVQQTLLTLERYFEIQWPKDKDTSNNQNEEASSICNNKTYLYAPSRLARICRQRLSSLQV